MERNKKQEKELMEEDKYLNNENTARGKRKGLDNLRNYKDKNLEDLVLRLAFTHYLNILKKANNYIDNLMEDYEVDSLYNLSTLVSGNKKDREKLESKFYELLECDEKIPSDLRWCYDRICEDYLKIILGKKTVSLEKYK